MGLCRARFAATKSKYYSCCILLFIFNKSCNILVYKLHQIHFKGNLFVYSSTARTVEIFLKEERDHYILQNKTSQNTIAHSNE